VLEEQDKTDELIALLTRTLVSFPGAFLDPGPPNWDWIYPQLINALLRRQRPDEALGWVRVRFAMSAYNEDAMTRAMRLLTHTWNMVDPSGRALLSLVATQRDGSQPNPLATVKLPAADPQLLSAQWARLGQGRSAAHDRINLHILAGDHRAAMIEALRLMTEANAAKEGALEVCRVFKAADLNLKRANAFLRFFNTGEGDNPLEAFFQEPTSPTEPAAAEPAGRLPKEILSLVVAAMNLSGEGAVDVPVLSEGFITTPILIEQMNSGRLIAETALKNGTLSPDDILVMLSTSPNLVGKNAGDLVKLLFKHTPERIKDPSTLSVGARYWLADYYRSVPDARAIALFEPLVALGKSSLDPATTPASPVVALYAESAERHLDWFYGEQGTRAPIICVPREILIPPLRPADKTEKRAGRTAEKAKPILRRLVLMSRLSEVMATTDNPRVKLRLEEKWRSWEGEWYYRHKDVLVEIAPEALTADFQTAIVVSSPQAPNFEVRVPVRVGVPEPLVLDPPVDVKKPPKAPPADRPGGAAAPGAAPEFEVGAGEIRLDGTIRSVNTKQKSFVMGVTAFTVPGGKTSKLSQPKAKTILFTEKTALHVIAGVSRTMPPSDVKAGQAVTVIGTDAGMGHDLPARVVVLGPMP
ncbi:MAG: hypothetical protein M3347_03200, partial [Armatimonadota bacterium]|nr:hypothetical protein [Armatimonadota bacterium]